MVRKIWLAAAALGLGVGGQAHAQTPASVSVDPAMSACAVRNSSPLKLGADPFATATVLRCKLDPTVADGDDYGGVTIRFIPPATPTPPNFKAAGFFQKMFTNSSASAFVVMQISVRFPQLGNEAVPAAIIPLMEYKFDRGSGGVSAAEKKYFADGLATPRFRIEEGMIVSAQIKVVQTKDGGTNIAEVLSPLAALAGEATGGGMLLSPVAGETFKSLEKGVNDRLNKSEFVNDSGFELGFDGVGNGGAGSSGVGNTLIYTLSLAAAQRDCQAEFANLIFKKKEKLLACEADNATRKPVTAGSISVRLDRVPSLIVGRNSVRNGRPNFRLDEASGSVGIGRVLSVRLAPGAGGSVGEKIDSDFRDYSTMVNLDAIKPDLQVRTFTDGCRQLRKAVGLSGGNPLPLSIHDRYAAFFAKLKDTRQLYRQDLQDAPECIGDEKAAFASYNFELPKPQPPIATPANYPLKELRKFWEKQVIPALTSPPSDKRESDFERLFRGKVEVNLRRDDGFSETLNGQVSRDDLTELFKPITLSSVGCAYRNGEGNGYIGLARAAARKDENGEDLPRPLYRMETGIELNEDGDLKINALRVAIISKEQFSSEFPKLFPEVDKARCRSFESAPSDK